MSRWSSDRSMLISPASVSDYREFARRRLPRQLFDYIDGGAYAESTMAANMADLQRIKLRQRVLRDVSHVGMQTVVLGEQLSMPVILGPVGLAGMYSTRAEVSAARAAHAEGVIFCESAVSICGLEEVSAATERAVWFQLYMMRDRGFVAALMERAYAAGCRVLLMTVDLAVVGARYRDVRNGLVGHQSLAGKVLQGMQFAKHPRWAWEVGIRGGPHTFGNLQEAVPDARRPEQFSKWVESQFDPSVTWTDLSWVRSRWPGKLVIKGVLDPEDARQAADCGADGIVVSNHGGRQLDSTPSTATALGPVVDAVGAGIEVLVDGGIRSGLDVAKVLALGARACLVGRAWAWAVAAGGEPAVRRMLNTVRSELRVALSLTGAADVGELDRSALVGVEVGNA